ncbi:hypothetical protein AKJ09_08981 [Labilithrix luteola]|uniref:Uncharacterized protein n=1 Tax=Labilithrix luteola TaxID=1391654 RepID=A0A0K1Q9A8_9BACT|nr:hypothetical protein [Labilithrix luteola]AKV02318.1 hypothetical protein AKJ09_08981 [Labilithrix luteola]
MKDDPMMIGVETAIRAMVREELVRLLGPSAARPIYSTERRELYPPGRYSDNDVKARRQARDRIRQVPGYEHVGLVYSVSAEAYRQHFAKPTRRVEAPAPANTNDEAIVAAALEGLGLRSTRVA